MGQKPQRIFQEPTVRVEHSGTQNTIIVDVCWDIYFCALKISSNIGNYFLSQINNLWYQSKTGFVLYV